MLKGTLRSCFPVPSQTTSIMGHVLFLSLVMHICPQRMSVTFAYFIIRRIMVFSQRLNTDIVFICDVKFILMILTDINLELY